MNPSNDTFTRTLCWQVEHADQKRYKKALTAARHLLLHIIPAALAILYAWLYKGTIENMFIFSILSASYLLLALGALYLYYHYAGGNGGYNVRYELKNDVLSKTYWLKPLPSKVKLLFRGYQALFAIFLVAALITTAILLIETPKYVAIFAITTPYFLMLIKAFHPKEIEKVHEKTIYFNEPGRWWLNPNQKKLSAKLLKRTLSNQMLITFNDSETSAQFERLLPEQYPQVKTIQSIIMRWFV